MPTPPHPPPPSPTGTAEVAPDVTAEVRDHYSGEPDAPSTPAPREPLHEAILAAVRDRPGITAAALAAELGVNRTTIYTRVAELVASGVQIGGRRGPRGGLFLRSAPQRPPLDRAQLRALLTTGRPVSLVEIAKQTGASPSKVQYELRQLRLTGAPLRSRRGSGGGFWLETPPQEAQEPQEPGAGPAQPR